MNSPRALTDLKQYFPPELGELMQEYEGSHFRHTKGKLTLWTRGLESNHMLDVKQEPYKGVGLSAVSGLWQVKLGPNRYERIIDDGIAEVFAKRAFILYNQSANLENLPSQLGLELKEITGNFEHCEVVICSDQRSVLAYSLHGKLFLSSCAVYENKVFVFLIDDKYSEEGAEINKKYNILYDSLFAGLQRMFLNGKKAKLANAEITIYESWDFFSPLLTSEVRQLFMAPDNLAPIEHVAISSVGLWLFGDDGPPLLLTKETAPQLWAIHEAMKGIESLDPNYLATVPADKVLDLLQ